MISIGNENIKKLYKLIDKNPEVQQKLQEIQQRLKNHELDQKGADEFILKVLVPIAKEEGIDFSLDDILAFESSIQELTDEELEDVIGGVSRVVSWGLTSLVMFSSLGGAASLVSGKFGASDGGVSSIVRSVQDLGASLVNNNSKSSSENDLQTTSDSEEGVYFSNLLRESIENYKGVDQGKLGDCWLISYLNTLSPESIKNMVKYVGNDNASVKFTIEGKEVYITQNIKEAIESHKGIPGKEDSVAADVIESAFAKTKINATAKGIKTDDTSTNNLNFGTAKIAMEALTGAEAQVVSASNANVFKIMADALKAGKAVTVSTKSTLEKMPGVKSDGESGGFCEKIGYLNGKRVVSAHQMTITGVNLKTGTVTMTNPWDHSEELEFSSEEALAISNNVTISGVSVN